MRNEITAKSNLKYLGNDANITKCGKISHKAHLTNYLTNAYNAFLPSWLHIL